MWDAVAWNANFFIVNYLIGSSTILACGTFCLFGAFILNALQSAAVAGVQFRPYPCISTSLSDLPASQTLCESLQTASAQWEIIPACCHFVLLLIRQFCSSVMFVVRPFRAPAMTFGTSHCIIEKTKAAFVANHQQRRTWC